LNGHTSVFHPHALKLVACDNMAVDWELKGTMSAGAHALSSPVGRFLRGVFLRRFV